MGECGGTPKNCGQLARAPQNLVHESVFGANRGRLPNAFEAISRERARGPEQRAAQTDHRLTRGNAG